MAIGAVGSNGGTRHSFLVFGAVGVVGFVVDASVMMLVVKQFMWHPVQGRAVSFPLAVTTTWLMNRSLTFRGGGLRSRSAEYAGYFVIQIIGAVVNVGAFLACIAIWPSLIMVPFVPLAFGSMVALLLNFSLLTCIVYRGNRHEQSSGDEN